MRLLTGSAAAGLLAIWLAACSSGAASAPGSAVATDHVDLPKSYRFDPAVITVPVGTTVTWTNDDDFTHSVRLADDGGKVMVMKPGETATFTFDKAGTHHYDCSFHPQNMKGTVIVTASGG
jgi:plastocyanin